ncbi:protein of unknown function [Taphrina deformans PYCC 5710]|uniref:DNA recombination and repair protein Rad51-like C-terminal domain-containing protein n=1 Tax=Taphrina deformans (strain PYCC 5710 / ATCC 11124 / CBS 356.35 / IMI 108563 / JCM 9778 / NBRC 8474) TaxID=1097556 RepID=R4XEH8_TAPDE|nr:protein of unknown function [Taphrina deformans PYCC 5710]|eukprot:CCG84067.1 protein of unknown function [Taphrina deformans PYCC 5710]
MFRARALLTQRDSCHGLLAYVRTQQPASLDIPLHPLLPSSSASYDQAIELHGLAGSGKTHLLYNLTIEAILAGDAVIVFDTDLKWDNARLLELLHARMSDQSTEDTTSGPFSVFGEQTCLELLDSVYMYQPASLAAFLNDAEDVLELCMRAVPDKSVRYILVDSFSAFHWQFVAVRKPSIVDVFSRLHKSAEEIAALLVYTTWDLGFPYIALPHSVRLTVSKKYVLQFTQGLAQAQETKEHRMEVIKRGISYVSGEASSERITFSITPEQCTFGKHK